MNPAVMSAIQGFIQQLSAQPGGLVPWAIREDAIAQSLMEVRAVRAVAERSQMDAGGAFPVSRRGERFASGSYATRVGSVAIVPVLGPLVSRFSMSNWSYDEIVRDLRLAESTPGITAVVLDVNSPGGIGSDVESVPREIQRIRQSMPVIAHVNGIAASAGFWVASGCEAIYAAESALVGSVGALISYVDMEGILLRLGATKTQVIAEQSPNKRLARDSEEGRAELQAIVDDGAEMFIRGLMENRNVTREKVMDDYGQGLVFPAVEALRRGLIDRIASFEEVLTELAARRENSITAATATAKVGTEKESTMLTLEQLRAEHPDLVSALLADGQATAAKAERDRLLGIDELAAGLKGHEALVMKLKADGKTTPAEAALQILAAEKAANADRLKGLEQLDNAAAGVHSTLSGGNENGKSFPQTEEGWKAEWEATPKLQEDFPTAASYVATMKRQKAA